MKPLLRILARLYPASWRKRYGAEFEALIEDARPGLGGALDILKGAFTMQLSSWTPFRVLAASLVVGVLVAIGIASTFPEMWSSRAVILTKKSRSRGDLGQTIQGVLSSKVLNDLIASQGLYPGDDEAVLEMRNAIHVTKLKNADVVSVQFAYPDPQRAQKVTQALANRIVEAEPEAFSLVELVSYPKPINPAFSAKFATMGAAGGLLLGVPVSALLYWRRRKP